VRIIAATNRDLEEDMQAKRFRQDLYYRLNVVNVVAPSLRNRREDIPLLAEHFLRRSTERNAKPIQGFSKDVMRVLAQYSWPGNVRELENVVERGVILDTDRLIHIDDLPDRLVDSPEETNMLSIPLGTTLDEIERQVIHATLGMTGGDKNLAAKLLGIAARTIYRKI
jgi:two-component system response regulator HydG